MIDIDRIARRELRRVRARDAAIRHGRGRPHMLGISHLSGFGAETYSNIGQVASLCNFNGSDLATSSTDSAGGTITHYYAYLTTSTKQFGTAGLRFDVDASNWYHVDISGRPGFTFPSDFTIEFWARHKTGYIYSANGYLMDSDQKDGTIFTISADNSSNISIDGTSWGGSGSIGMTLSTSAFKHVAIVRHAGTLTGYLDGVSQGSFSSTGTLNPSGCGITLGGLNINNLWNGYLDGFRVYKDHAVYTSNFTPPSSELGLS